MDRTVNGVTTRFYWDGFTPYMEASGSNMQYAYFGSNIRFDLGSNYAVDTSDSAHVLLRDEAGNIVAVTNKTGTLESHFEYDAWGNDLNSTFSNAQNVRQFRTGKFLDSATGLYYNQARWYDPTLGRFISESPIAPFAEEEYVYCGNDPVNRLDGNGLDWGYWLNLDFLPYKDEISDWLGDKINCYGLNWCNGGIGSALNYCDNVNTLVGTPRDNLGKFNEAAHVISDQVATEAAYLSVGAAIKIIPGTGKGKYLDDINPGNAKVLTKGQLKGLVTAQPSEVKGGGKGGSCPVRRNSCRAEMRV